VNRNGKIVGLRGIGAITEKENQGDMSDHEDVVAAFLSKICIKHPKKWVLKKKSSSGPSPPSARRGKLWD
jgi:hypothetical protein